jgi:hypothetical protein
MKNFRSAFIYIIIALVLGGYIYFFEQGPTAQQKSKTYKIFHFVAAQVNGLTIQQFHQKKKINNLPIEITEVPPDHWKIISPRKHNADTITVRSILGQLGSMHPDLKIKLINPALLVEAGLNSPTARISYHLVNGTTQVLTIGNKSISGSDYYVETSAQKKFIYLMPTFVIQDSLKTLNKLRNRHLIKTDAASARKFLLVYAHRRILISKNPQLRSWEILEPHEYQADASSVKSMLDQVNLLRAISIVAGHPANLASYGFNHPKVEFTVWPLQGNVTQEILIGSKVKGGTDYYAKLKHKKAVYLISNYFVNVVLNKTVDHFRNKNMMQFNSADALRLTIHYHHKIFVYSKNKKGNWICIPGRPNSNEEAVALISELSQTTVTGFPVVSKASSDLVHPPMVADVTLIGNTMRNFEFGKVVANNVYTTSYALKRIYLVSNRPVNLMNSYFKTPVPTPTVPPKK